VFAGNLFKLCKDCLLYYPARFGINRSGNLRIATARLPFFRKLNKISLPEPDYFGLSDHKGIVDSDAYTRPHVTTISKPNSDFGDLHGISLEPIVCPCSVDVVCGLMALKRRKEIMRFSPN